MPKNLNKILDYNWDDNIIIDPSLDLEKEILKLKKEMNAVILAHYYQDPEIQDIADFLGDSLALSQKAASLEVDVIVFCGVRFMADVAKIVNPSKKILIPDNNAGCSLESSCQEKDFKKFIEKYPNHIVISYINCSIGVKALSDIIVTSSNAEHIIKSIPEDQPIIFAPDKYLGSYLIRKTGRDMVLWNGTCIVHENFSEKELIKLKTNHPDAKVIAHPECSENLLRYADHIGSTSSLLKYTTENDGQKFIVLTERGIIHQMKKNARNSLFYDVPSHGVEENGECHLCSECPYMRLNTLEKVYICMLKSYPYIEIDNDLAKYAGLSINKMLEISSSIKK